MNRETSLSPAGKRQMEKYSSAFTLSDMEIFIFPDLFILLSTNIMSPLIWKWCDDPGLKVLTKKDSTTR